MAKFFVNPFAVAGDRSAIPDTIPLDNSINYETGYSADYQGVYGTDPNAKAVARLTFNELMFDITDAIKQYQTHGFPDFIASSDNLGSPYSYDIYSVVRYNPGSGTKLYVSQVDSNTALPTDNTKWAPVGSAVVAMMGLTLGQTLPDRTLDLVKFDTIIYDDYGICNTSALHHSFTVKFSGYYEISTLITLNATAPSVDSVLYLYAYVNGSQIRTIGQTLMKSSTSGDSSGGPSVPILLNQGDIVVVNSYNDNGGGQDMEIGGGTLSNYVKLTYLGPQP